MENTLGCLDTAYSQCQMKEFNQTKSQYEKIKMIGSLLSLSHDMSKSRVVQISSKNEGNTK